MLQMKNRNPIKQWEVTFPQIGQISKQEFADAFPPSDYTIVALEEHEDGGHHLHMGLKLKKGLTHSKMIKWLESKFPEDWKRIHVSPIKKMDLWIDYCKKEDPSVLIIGTLTVHTNRKPPVFTDEQLRSAQRAQDLRDKTFERNCAAYALIAQYEQELFDSDPDCQKMISETKNYLRLKEEKKKMS